jgi:hypothetical protein
LRGGANWRRATAPCNTETACTQLARRTRRMGILGEDIPRRGKQQAGTDSYGQYEVFHLWIPSVETLTHQIHPCRAYSAYGAAGCTLLRMNPNRLPRTADSDRLRLGPRPVTSYSVSVASRESLRAKSWNRAKFPEPNKIFSFARAPIISDKKVRFDLPVRLRIGDQRPGPRWLWYCGRNLPADLS